MKKLLQMKFMLLLCALIVGSGTMWAETEVLSWSRSGTTNTYTTTVNLGSKILSNVELFGYYSRKISEKKSADKKEPAKAVIKSYSQNIIKC